MTDITDRKLAQEAAEQASRVKSWLLTEINSLHDQLKQENTAWAANWRLPGVCSR